MNLQRILKFGLLFVLLGCNSANTTKKEEAKIDKDAELYMTNKEDNEMNEAISLANKSIFKFHSALMSGNPKFYDFALKKKYETLEGAEHIWIGNVWVDKGTYFGLVGNQPERIPNLNYGDTVKVELATISDWMYVDNNKLQGGYTIRVVRKHLSLEEKKQFDKEAGFIIEE